MRSISFLLVISLLIPNVASALVAPGPFPDVMFNHSNAEAIRYVKDQRIVEGNPDGSFAPSALINRAAFTKIITLALYDQRMIDMCGSNVFPDIAMDAWYRKYVCRAKDGWLLTGYPDGTFRPNNSINFSEAAKILANGFNLIQRDEHCNGGLCPDVDTYDHPWYERYVKALAEKNAIPTSIMKIDQLITRGEMAEMIYRLKAGVTTKASRTYEELAGLRNPSTVQEKFHFNDPRYAINMGINGEGDCTWEDTGPNEEQQMLDRGERISGTIPPARTVYQFDCADYYVPDFQMLIFNEPEYMKDKMLDEDFSLVGICGTQFAEVPTVNRVVRSSTKDLYYLERRQKLVGPDADKNWLDYCFPTGNGFVATLRFIVPTKDMSADLPHIQEIVDSVTLDMD